MLCYALRLWWTAGRVVSQHTLRWRFLRSDGADGGDGHQPDPAVSLHRPAYHWSAQHRRRADIPAPEARHVCQAVSAAMSSSLFAARHADHMRVVCCGLSGAVCRCV